MELSNAFILTNEIVHSEIEQYKKAAIADAGYKGLTINLMAYIEAVDSLKKPALGDVAKHLNVSSASASLAIGKLIVSNFLKKEQSNFDKRVYRIRLTKKSKELLKKQSKAIASICESVISPLSNKEQSLLHDACLKIIVAQNKNDVDSLI